MPPLLPDDPLPDAVALAQLRQQQRTYWRKNLAVTIGLLLFWFCITYVSTYFARELNALTLFGFPLGFYVSAQGALLVYVLIVGLYARRMNRHDEAYRVQLEAWREQYRTLLAVQQTAQQATPFPGNSRLPPLSRSPVSGKR